MVRRKAAAPPILPGYSYIRPLGSGGFADVYLFEQDMPRRVVAVKVLVDDAVNPEVIRTFNAEADIMARLSAHASIVTIYQASISADGRPYFVMEYCPDTMSARYKKAPLAVGEVLDTGVRMAAALETAHRSGLLHRDIKPSNILISSLGSPVLADFGVAAALEPLDDTEEVFAMSVPWSAPEVLEQRITGSVASEVWSLGATLYTLLASRSPFESTDREKNRRDVLTARVIKAKYTPIGRPDVSAKIEQILARSMSKDPGARQESMYALGEELRWAQYELGIAPTTLEVAATEWAAAAAPVDFASSAPRGPIISTVNKESRRAVRAAQAYTARRNDDDGVLPPKPAAPWKAALIGGLVGAAVLAVVGIVALFALGVL